MEADNDDFDGSLILEKLAEAGRLDDFYESIDEDDFKRARKILRETGFPIEMIHRVIQEIQDADE